jgi:4-hydroxy-tetrahydrodipicolinate reductase
MLKLGLQGWTGRTGHLVLNAIESANDQFKLVVVSELHNNNLVFIDPETKNLSTVLPEVWIDFSSPEGTQSLLKKLEEIKSNSKVLVATTGHSEEQIESIKQHAQNRSILLAPNTSLGVFLSKMLVAKAAEFLANSEWICHVHEVHHKNKKDAPSGTARYLGESVSRQEIPVTYSSVRAGDVVGEHKISFYFEGEQLEISHIASNRAVFASGAIKLANVLAKKPSGYYELTEDFFR